MREHILKGFFEELEKLSAEVHKTAATFVGGGSNFSGGGFSGNDSNGQMHRFINASPAMHMKSSGTFQGMAAAPGGGFMPAFSGGEGGYTSEVPGGMIHNYAPSAKMRAAMQKMGGIGGATSEAKRHQQEIVETVLRGAYNDVADTVAPVTTPIVDAVKSVLPSGEKKTAADGSSVSILQRLAAGARGVAHGARFTFGRVGGTANEAADSVRQVFRPGHEGRKQTRIAGQRIGMLTAMAGVPVAAIGVGSAAGKLHERRRQQTEEKTAAISVPGRLGVFAGHAALGSMLPAVHPAVAMYRAARHARHAFAPGKEGLAHAEDVGSVLGSLVPPATLTGGGLVAGAAAGKLHERRARQKEKTAEKTLREAFEEKIDDKGRWTGGLNSDGYPKMRDGKDIRLASHVALELAGRGPAPKDKVVAHLDNNPKNLNPSNLRITTQKANLQQAEDQGRWRPRGPNKD